MKQRSILTRLLIRRRSEPRSGAGSVQSDVAVSMLATPSLSVLPCRRDLDISHATLDKVRWSALPRRRSCTWLEKLIHCLSGRKPEKRKGGKETVPNHRD